LISVIIILEGSTDAFQRTLQGLQSQTLQDYELFVVDDASKGSAWSMLSEAKIPRLRAHRNRSPQGFARCVTRALGWVDGEYVAFHGLGDLSATERFEKQVELLARRDEVAAVTSGIEWIGGRGEALRELTFPPQHARIMKQLLEEESFVDGSMMARRSMLAEGPVLREELGSAALLDLWLRLGERHKLAALQTVLYRHHFDLDAEEVAHFARHNALIDLARQCSIGRDADGAEPANWAEIASRIRDSFAGGSFISQRKRQARNYWLWAAWLDTWGVAAAHQAQDVRTRARRLWPFGAGETDDLQG